MSRKKPVTATTLQRQKNPYRYRAGNIRSTMLSRARHLPRPSLDELEAWLRDQPLHCAYKGTPLTLETCQVDHQQPLDRMGTHDLANLCLASPDANREKGAMTADEYHQLLALIGHWEDRGEGLLRRLRTANTIFGRAR